MSTRSLRSAGYQPLQSHEDGPDIETEPRVQAGPSRASVSQRRQLRPGSIDLTKLDNAFKRCVFAEYTLVHYFMVTQVD